jgi:hypothetical protein
MLDTESRLLGAVEDWIDAIYSAAPDPEDFW